MVKPVNSLYLGRILQQGFTILELLVTLSVAGILITMAATAYVRTAGEHRVLNFIDALRGDIQWARAQAIGRNEVTQLVFSNDSCSTWAITLGGTTVEGKGMSSSELARAYQQVSCSYTGAVPTFDGLGQFVTVANTSDSHLLSGCTGSCPAPINISSYVAGANDFMATIKLGNDSERTWKMRIGSSGDLIVTRQ